MNYLEMEWLLVCIEHTDDESYAEACMLWVSNLINNQRQKEEEAKAKAKLMQELNRDIDVDLGIGWIEIALIVMSYAMLLWVLLGHRV